MMNKILQKLNPNMMGAGGSSYVGGDMYTPMESHPDWELIGGEAPPSPTTFDASSGEFSTTSAPSGFYPLFNTAFGLHAGFNISCNILYEGLDNTFEMYPIAVGLDENNFIGVTSYNGVIMIYGIDGGTWFDVGLEVSAVGTLGDKIQMMLFPDGRVDLVINGDQMGIGTSPLSGDMYAGVILRDMPGANRWFTNLHIEVL